MGEIVSVKGGAYVDRVNRILLERLSIKADGTKQTVQSNRRVKEKKRNTIGHIPLLDSTQTVLKERERLHSAIKARWRW